jgi:glycine cleavage system H lipoate-binding protein
MHATDFLSGYSAKLLEYGLAVTYLVLFVAFWRYVQGGRKAPQAAAAALPVLARFGVPVAGWFTVPDGVELHPGHTWARMEKDGTVAVGLDDLGHRLIGPVEGIALPRTGARVEQGEAAVTLAAGGRKVALVSPVEGEVVAANRELSAPHDGGRQPYGDGWLFRVRPLRWKRDRAQLLSGQAARDWIEEQGYLLAARLAPEPAAMLQDGGAPVDGIAREIDPERWDAIAREFFHSEEA